jgi:predicted kinase
MLIIVCGLQGTGKTTVAKRIAEKINAILLRTDVLRKELVQVPQYTKEEKRRVYDEMFARAKSLLQNDVGVVLDANFSEQSYRNQARELAQKTHTEFKIVEVDTPEKIVKTRLENRFGDESEAGYREYLRNRDLFEPITEDHILIDNSGALNDTDLQIAVHF